MASDNARGPIPFSVGDVFDYVIPGATLLAAASLFERRLESYLENDQLTPIFDLLRTLIDRGLANDNAIMSLIVVFAMAVGAYVAGHVIASFSSLFIDRTLIFKGHGYPYRYLLGLHRFDSRGPQTANGAFYRGFFFHANVFLLVSLYWLIKGGDEGLPFWGTKVLLWSLGVAVLIKLLFSNTPWRRPGSLPYQWISAPLLRLKQHLRTLAARSSRSRIRNTAPRVARWCLRKASLNRVARLYAAPYDSLANLYTTYTNARGPLELCVREMYMSAFEKQFGNHPRKLDSSNFWLTLCFVSQRAPELAKLTSNWLRLYEFARNLGTALFLGFAYCTLSLFLHRNSFNALTDPMLIVGPFSLYGLAFIMLGRYYYLYVCYYSKFLFRAFVYLNSNAASSSAGATVAVAAVPELKVP